MNRNVASALSVLADLAAIAAAAAIVSTSAYADDITVEQTPFVSSLSRAEVQAEVTKHVRQIRGANSDWVLQYNEAPLTRSDLTSQQAKAAYILSREYVNALNAEDSGAAYFGKTEAPLRGMPTSLMGGPAR